MRENAIISVVKLDDLKGKSESRGKQGKQNRIMLRGLISVCIAE